MPLGIARLRAAACAFVKSRDAMNSNLAPVALLHPGNNLANRYGTRSQNPPLHLF